MASTTTDALTAKVHTQTTTTPVTSLPNISQLDMKDQREYERARQRALKPSDRVLKGLFRPPKRPDGNIGRGPKRHLHASHNSFRYAPNPRWDAWIEKSDLILDEDDVVDDLQCAEPDCAIPPRDTMHVSLNDLIKPERKRNGIAQGYELVPRLRPVMIIEESPSDDNVSSEEEAFDWELIPAPRTPSRLTKKLPVSLTYASVMSSSASKASSK